MHALTVLDTQHLVETERGVRDERRSCDEPPEPFTQRKVSATTPGMKKLPLNWLLLEHAGRGTRS